MSLDWAAKILALSTAMVAVAGCGPTEQGKSASALLTRDSETLLIEMPACENGYVGMFNIFGAGGVLEMRGSTARFAEPTVVTIVISKSTLKNFDFSPYVYLLDETGGGVRSVDEIRDVYLNTDVGVIEFDPRSVVASADGRSILDGKKSRPAASSETARDLLQQACE